MEEIKKGIYRHYKGHEYRVLGEATETEGKESVVIYQDLEDENKIWTRPRAMFLSDVETSEGKKPRFLFLQAEDDSWENKYWRALADYHNLTKQVSKEKSEFAKYAIADFLQDILPVYDHLKLSLSGLSEEEKNNPWAQGVGHVLKQFREVLSRHGVEEIQTVGEKFDHDTMEALDGSGETVAKEVLPGYKLNCKVIRHAKVIVE